MTNIVWGKALQADRRAHKKVQGISKFRNQDRVTAKWWQREEKVFGSQKSNKGQTRTIEPFTPGQKVRIYITINKPLSTDREFMQKAYLL